MTHACKDSKRGASIVACSETPAARRLLASILLLVSIVGIASAFASPARAGESAQASPPPIATAVAPASEADLATRVADLEAYVKNGQPRSMTTTSGPGHNAWMMTSTALVLFMTLPGLALFYGGLVRRKNVLSVMAQCLGCAGLVTILWWAVGYSLHVRPGFARSSAA